MKEEKSSDSSEKKRKTGNLMYRLNFVSTVPWNG